MLPAPPHHPPSSFSLLRSPYSSTGQDLGQFHSTLIPLTPLSLWENFILCPYKPWETSLISTKQLFRPPLFLRFPGQFRPYSRAGFTFSIVHQGPVSSMFLNRTEFQATEFQHCLSSHLGDHLLPILRATALWVFRLVPHFCLMMPYMLPQRET